jgi:hypothetical protein
LDEVIELTKDENLRKIRNEEAATLEVVKESYIALRYFLYSVDRIVVEKAYNLTKAILNDLKLVE